MPRPNNTYTPSDVCKRFRISRTTLFRLEEKGDIPPIPRDSEGNRCYSEENLKQIGSLRIQRTNDRIQRINDTEKHINSQISHLDPNIPERSKTVDKLLAERSYLKYLSDHDKLSLQDLKIRAKLGRLPVHILEQIQAQLSALPIKAEEFADLVEVLYLSSQSSKHRASRIGSATATNER